MAYLPPPLAPTIAAALEMARDGVRKDPKSVDALASLAWNELIAGQAHTAAVWYQHLLKKLAKPPHTPPTGLSLGRCLRDALFSFALSEQAEGVQSLLCPETPAFEQTLGLRDSDLTARLPLDLPAWSAVQKPIPSGLVIDFATFRPGPSRQSTPEFGEAELLLVLLYARFLQDQGTRISCLARSAPRGLTLLIGQILGEDSLCHPEDLAQRAGLGSAWVPAKRMVWELASLPERPALPSCLNAPSPSHAAPWLVVPPTRAAWTGLTYRQWQALNSQSRWDAFEGPRLGLFDGAGETLFALRDAIGAARGVICCDGPVPLLAAALGKPVVILSTPGPAFDPRVCAQPYRPREWWWGARKQGCALFPNSLRVTCGPLLGPSSLVKRLAQATQTLERGSQPFPASAPIVLDAKSQATAWPSWAKQALLRASPHLPDGSGPYALKELTGGTHNALLRVKGPTKTTVVRQDDWPVHPSDFYLREFTNMQKAAAHGLAPQPLHADLQDGFLVLPYLPGPFLTNKDIRDPDCAALVARHYRRLHQLDGFVGGYDPFTKLAARRKQLDRTPTEPYRALADRHPLLDEIAALLTSATPPACACHNDAIPDNLARQGDGLLFIDWQIAGMGDPHWDLGSFVGQITMTDGQKDDFYQAYFGHPDHPGRSRASLFEVFAVYYNLIRALDDGRKKPDKSRWKRRHDRWLAFLDRFETDGRLDHHIKQAQHPDAVEPMTE